MRFSIGFVSQATAGGGGGGGGSTDEFIANVKLLEHFETVADLGGGTYNFVAAINSGSGHGFAGSGTAWSQETVSPLLGSGSLKLADSGNMIASQHEATHDIASGDDFTVEFWCKPDTLAVANLCVLADGAKFAIYCEADGKIHAYLSGAEAIVSDAGVLVADSVAKIAVTRASGTTRLFVNGALIGAKAGSDTTAYNAVSGGWQLGAGGNAQPGVYDEFRLTIGTARYTSAYTPATTAFPDS